MIIKKFYLKKGENPYLKQIEKIGSIHVWLVDGAFIRKEICEDFVNCGQHYHFPFIPKNEFWISKEIVPGEINFHIEFLLTEYWLMKEGIPKEKATILAERAEKKERKRSEKIKNMINIKNHKEIVEKVHKKFLKEYNSQIKIWVVKGELVRDLLDIDYAGGSHDKLDNFIPKNEIWLDDDMDEHEQKFILLHELHERFWMSKGMTYKPAHRKATKIEDYHRRHPEKVDKAIQKELSRQVF